MQCIYCVCIIHEHVVYMNNVYILCIYAYAKRHLSSDVHLNVAATFRNNDMEPYNANAYTHIDNHNNIIHTCI